MIQHWQREPTHRRPRSEALRHLIILPLWLLLGSASNAAPIAASTTLSDFHWLRPLWLLAIIPIVALLVALRRNQRQQSNWQSVIDSDLLAALSNEKHRPHPARWPLMLLALAWLLAALSLAGPSWKRLPQPTFEQNEALVILLDLSASMYATDANPSRLVKARREIQDVLRLRDGQGGTTALIAYAGNAHAVTPLTEDTKAIELLLPSLSPGIMPAQGNNPLQALQLAEQIIEDAQVSRARLLLITDGLPAADFDALAEFVQHTPHTLSVLGIGTEVGAPIPLPRGGFLTNRSGEVIIAKLNQQAIQQWAKKTDVRYQHSHFSDRDVDSLLANDHFDLPLAQQVSEDTRTFDSWQDFGPRLALLLLPLAALSFRRGWLLCALLCSVLYLPQPAYAAEWKNLWLNDNQQAQQALEEENPEHAATLFRDEQWQGVARYQAGDYAGAAEAFAQQDTSQGNYNRGNALAMQGELQAAIDAYQRALELDPNNSDAASNKRQLEQLLEQQEKSTPKNQDQDQQDNNGESPEDANKTGSESGEDSSEGDAPSDSERQNTDGSDATAQDDKPQAQGDSGSPEQAAEEAGETSDGEEAAHSNTPEEQATPTSPDTDATDASANSEPDDSEQDAGNANTSATANDTSLPSQSTVNPELQQWLRQIPDEPGKLLQRKFEYQYRRQPQRPRDANQEERY